MIDSKSFGNINFTVSIKSYWGLGLNGRFQKDT